jgi:DNA-binding IscR family transcriptional regulator
LKGLWKETRDAVARILEGTTFADLAVRTRAARTAEEAGPRAMRKEKTRP